jgi:hypothetical protein
MKQLWRLTLLNASMLFSKKTGLVFSETESRGSAMLARSIRLRCLLVLFSILILPSFSHASDLVIINAGGDASPGQKQLEIAAQFYGLNARVVTVEANRLVPVLDALQQNSTLAAAIEVKALALLDRKSLLRALDRESGKSVPLLIFGVSPDTEAALLAGWSGGAIIGSQQLVEDRALRYSVGTVAGVTGQLSELGFFFPGDRAFYFVPAASSTAQKILTVRSDHQAGPVFIEAEVERHKIFLLCEKPSGRNAIVERIADDVVAAFAQVAPAMIFTRYAAGNRGWHAIDPYANFTIDDPWLRQPYGHLDYQGLFKEMEGHNFHTTIAFIPWNYDRSEPSVVALFRGHPERFSICVHGDNHDHREFGDLASRPLNVQTAALEQSLARMEKFQILTGIPYDRVFVFPHNIGSESILEKLKAYNFLATVNAGNIPMDRSRPQTPLFALRAVTMAFGDFPSVDRLTAGLPEPRAFIAIDEFLGNPLFFYAHQDFFDHGIDAFNHVADEVNQIEPEMRWRSTGEIARHLYQVRERDDSGYDVLVFSSSLDLENPFANDVVFHLQKPESGSALIASVTAGGQPVPFELRGGVLHVSVAVPAGQARRVEILYKNNLDLASVSVAKTSLRVHVLRKISDYRDITLSKSSAGRALTDFYYKHPRSTVILLVGGAGFFVLVCWGVWRLARRKRQDGAGKQTRKQAPVCPA